MPVMDNRKNPHIADFFFGGVNPRDQQRRPRLMNVGAAQDFTYLPQGTVVRLVALVNGQSTGTVAGPMQTTGGRLFYPMLLPGGSNEFPNTAVVSTTQISNIVSRPRAAGKFASRPAVAAPAPAPQTFAAPAPTGTRALPADGDSTWWWIGGGVVAATAVGLGLLSFFSKKKK